MTTSTESIFQDVSLDNYFALEAILPDKHEYRNHSVVCMPYKSFTEINISSNAFMCIRPFLNNKSQKIIFGGMRIAVEAHTFFTYADLIIFCDKPQLYKTHDDTTTNPTVLIEVTSTSTQCYDRGDKFSLYRDLTSLKEYILISSTKVLVEHHLKQADDEWKLTIYRKKENSLTINSISSTMPIEAFYENVDFEA